MMTTLFNVKTKLNNLQLEPDLGLEFANQLNIEVKKKNIEVQLTIDLDRIIMKRSATFIPSQSA